MARDDPTIYECAGGPAAFERWLGRFYDLVEDDELLAPVFGGTVGEQPRRDVVTWWCEVMGGPADHTAGLGGYEHVLGTHRGLRITGEHRLRFVTCWPSPPTRCTCPTTRSSAPRSRATRSGARGSRCTTPAT